jgi:hypothetical protein
MNERETLERAQAHALKALKESLEAEKKLSSRRWPVLLAVASAVLLAFLLGLYVGWRQP